MAEELARIQLLIDNTANWERANPILLSGEVGFEVKTNRNIGIKVGDGMTAWNLLDYVSFTPAEITAMQEELQTEIDVITVSGTDGSSEVAQARVTADGTTYATLKARLDAADAADVQITEELIEYKNDTVKISPNIFDKETVESGYYDDDTVNIREQSNSAYYRAKVKIEGGKTYTISRADFYILTSSDGVTFNERLNGGAQAMTNVVVRTQPNDNYIFFSWRKNGLSKEEYMVVEGENLPSEYIPYGYIINGEYKKFLSNTMGLESQINKISDELTEYKNDTVKISSNIFDKETVESGFYDFEGTNIITQTNSAFCRAKVKIEGGKTYTISRADFYVLTSTDGVNYTTRLNGGAQAMTNVVVPTQPNDNYIFFSWRKSSLSKEEYMVVEGETLPSEYIPYGYIINNEYKKFLSNTVGKKNIYTVGENKDFSTFTECIRALKDDNSEKEIHIDAGVYDIYAEMGGEEFVNSIPTDATEWRDYSDIIPPNTHVIGVGNVVFTYYPTVSTNVSSQLISPVNIAGGNVTLENISIIGRNCRYTIHDDGSGTNDSVKHKYKNVLCEKLGGGYNQAFGSGIGNNCEFEFENCIIKSNREAFSVHNQWYALNSIITFSGCVLQGTTGMRLSSLSTNVEKPILVNAINSVISNVKYTNEDGNAERTNPYKLTLIKCGEPEIINNAFAENPFPPVIYN